MKVYVIFFLSKTWTELVGVYSTQEKAQEVYNNFLSQMSGSDNCNGLTVCIRTLDEPYSNHLE